MRLGIAFGPPTPGPYADPRHRQVEDPSERWLEGFVEWIAVTRWESPDSQAAGHTTPWGARVNSLELAKPIAACQMSSFRAPHRGADSGAPFAPPEFLPDAAQFPRGALAGQCSGEHLADISRSPAKPL